VTDLRYDPAHSRRGMEWSLDALIAAQKAMEVQGEAIREKAEDVARSHNADRVTPRYVALACELANLRKPQSRFTAVWLAGGTALAAAVVGFWLTVWAAPPEAAISMWSWMASACILALGVAMTGIAVVALRSGEDL
jgi:hypothetical protein